MNKSLLAFGLLCQGIMIYTMVMMISYISNALEIADQAIEGDLSAVSAELAKGYDVSLAGALTGLVGLLAYFLTAKRIKEKKPWIRNCGLLVSAIHLPLFPIGTILGGLSLHYFLTKKSDFRETKNEVEPGIAHNAGKRSPLS